MLNIILVDFILIFFLLVFIIGVLLIVLDVFIDVLSICNKDVILFVFFKLLNIIKEVIINIKLYLIERVLFI